MELPETYPGETRSGHRDYVVPGFRACFPHFQAGSAVGKASPSLSLRPWSLSWPLTQPCFAISEAPSSAPSPNPAASQAFLTTTTQASRFLSVSTCPLSHVSKSREGDSPKPITSWGLSLHQTMGLGSAASGSKCSGDGSWCGEGARASCPIRPLPCKLEVFDLSHTRNKAGQEGRLLWSPCRSDGPLFCLVQ